MFQRDRWGLTLNRKSVKKIWKGEYVQIISMLPLEKFNLAQAGQRRRTKKSLGGSVVSSTNAPASGVSHPLSQCFKQGKGRAGESANKSDEASKGGKDATFSR